MIVSETAKNQISIGFSIFTFVCTKNNIKK
jgi:hypothetical protein